MGICEKVGDSNLCAKPKKLQVSEINLTELYRMVHQKSKIVKTMYFSILSRTQYNADNKNGKIF